MTLRYEYSTAESYYVLLTFLIFLLVPATYLYNKSPYVSTITKKNISITLQNFNQTDKHVDTPAESNNDSGTSILRKLYAKYFKNLTLASILLRLGWFALVIVLFKIATSRTVIEVWDPHSVLQIPTSASRSDIKKAYRQLSLTQHPDKVPASERKSAETKFVDISKAYKVLTNAKARKNFELYGHPDGPQATSFGIGLPPWMTNPTFVIVAYLSLMVSVGVSVYRLVTYGTVFGTGNKVLENGLMKEPIEKLALTFKQAKENTPPLTVEQVFSFVAGVARAHHPDFVLTPVQVKLLPKGARDSNPMMQALQAHINQIPDVVPSALVKTFLLTCETVLSLAVQRGRMVDVGACINAYRAIALSCKPTDSMLLALPNMTLPIVTKLGVHLSPLGLVKQGRDFLDSKLGSGVSVEMRDKLWECVIALPVVQIVNCTFGDMSLDVTPGNEPTPYLDSDFIACTLTMNLATVKDHVDAEATTASSKKKLGNMKKSASGLEHSLSTSGSNKDLPSAFAQAPATPITEKPCGIWIFLSESTKPKIAPIMNCTYVALNDPSLAEIRDTVTGEFKVRMAIRGPHYAGPLSITVSVFSIPYGFIDESRTFKLKLDPLSKKSLDQEHPDTSVPALYRVIDVPVLASNASANDLDLSGLADNE